MRSSYLIASFLAGVLCLSSSFEAFAQTTAPSASSQAEAEAAAKKKETEATLQSMFGNKTMPQLPDFKKGSLVVVESGSGEHDPSGFLDQENLPVEREKKVRPKKTSFNELEEAVDDL